MEALHSSSVILIYLLITPIKSTSKLICVQCYCHKLSGDNLLVHWKFPNSKSVINWRFPASTRDILSFTIFEPIICRFIDLQLS